MEVCVKEPIFLGWIHHSFAETLLRPRIMYRLPNDLPRGAPNYLSCGALKIYRILTGNAFSWNNIN